MFDVSEIADPIKPDVYMIGLINNEISMHWRNQCIDSWREKGYNVIHFEGKTPREIEDLNILKFSIKHRSGTRGRKVEFTPTEKAVWYSHLFAWYHCIAIQKPMIVIEHDIKLERELPKRIYDQELACFAYDLRDDGEKFPLAGGAYYITPEGARMLSLIKYNRNIRYNSDAWLYNRCCKIGKWFPYCARQLKDENIGTTIEHNH